MKDEKEKTMNPERRKMLQKLLDSHLELQRLLTHTSVKIVHAIE